MTRNGCRRECSSLSVAGVPLVYLSGARAAPFHPGETAHGERPFPACFSAYVFFLFLSLSGPPPIVSRKLTFNCFLPVDRVRVRVRVEGRSR